jgi:hypothetical protein
MPDNVMQTAERIGEHRAHLMQQKEYLHEFLSLQYKGSDVKPKIERELKVIDVQINLLSWVLNERNDDLPF